MQHAAKKGESACEWLRCSLRARGLWLKCAYDGGGDPRSCCPDFPWGNAGRSGDREPLKDAQAFNGDQTLPKANLEVQYEDGQKSSPRLRRRFGCGDWGAGGRSSRKGQAGRIREGRHSTARVLYIPSHTASISRFVPRNGTTMPAGHRVMSMAHSHFTREHADA